MTARDLERAASLKPGSISKLERNQKRLQPDALVALSGALKLDIDGFFEGAPSIEPSDARISDKNITTAEIENLVLAFLSITNPKSRREFSRLVRSIANNPLFNTPMSENDAMALERNRSTS